MISAIGQNTTFCARPPKKKNRLPLDPLALQRQSEAKQRLNAAFDNYYHPVAKPLGQRLKTFFRGLLHPRQVAQEKVLEKRAAFAAYVKESFPTWSAEKQAEYVECIHPKN